MTDILILNNKYDRTGEDLLKDIPSDVDYRVIDWYGAEGERNIISARYGGVSGLPAIVNLKAGILFNAVKGWDDYKDKLESKLWDKVRQNRNHLIKQTDWMVLPDVELSDRKLEEIREYRQELRDLPDKYEDPREIEYPKPPDFIDK